MQVGTKITLTKDANLKYDSYGSGRPDGQTTQTLKAGTQVEITNIVNNPKPGQTHPVHVNNIGWIPADAVGAPAAATAGAARRNLSVGCSGEDVKAIQRIIGTPADGVFGPNTKAALINYQSANGLVADGIAGPKTFARMGL